MDNTPPSTPHFIGRTGELAFLGQVYSRARAGHPAVVLIDGAAGVGKTRLVDEALRTVIEDAHVLRGGSSRGQQGVPYAAVADAFRAALRQPSFRLAGDHRDAVEDIVNAPHREAGGASGLGDRTRRSEAILELLAEQDRPVVLTMDDLHWADSASLDLLRFVIRNVGDVQLLIILLTRESAGSDSVGAVFAEATARSIGYSIGVEPFTVVELGELFNWAGGDLPDRVVSDVAEASGGNALLALHLLGDRGRIRFAASAGLRQLIAAEVAQLSPAGRAVLRLLAVADAELDNRLLDEVLPGEVRSALAECRRIGLTVWGATHSRLHHALYGEILRNLLLPDEIQEQHLLLARAATRLSHDAAVPVMAPAEVARHWLEAREVATALPVLRAAAESALSASAFAESQSLWSELVTLIETHHGLVNRIARREIYARAALAARAVGEFGAALELLTRALRLTTPEEQLVRAELHTRSSDLYRSLGRMDAARWHVERAVALLPPDENGPSGDTARTAIEVRSEYARIITLSGDPRLGRELASACLDAARRTGAADLEAAAETTLGTALSGCGDAPAAVNALRNGARLAASYAPIEENIRACTNLSFALIDDGQLAAGLVAAREAIELARRSGMDKAGSSAAVARCNIITALFMLGDWEDAEREITAMLNAHPDPFTGDWLLATRAQIYVAQGRFELAHAAIDSISPDHDHSVALGRASVESEYWIWKRDSARALACAREPLRSSFAVMDRAYLMQWCLRAIGDQAATCRLQSRVSELDQLRATSDELLSQFGADFSDESSAVPELLCFAEYDRAFTPSRPDRWRAVVERAPRRSYERAYGCLRLAQVHLAERAEDAGRALLEESLDCATALGARPLLSEIEVTRIRYSLNLGSSAQSSAGPGADLPRLTRREREVLEHLKSGLSNRRIASALGISENTAGVHVSNILSKLGVSNRTAAAAVSRTIGL